MTAAIIGFIGVAYAPVLPSYSVIAALLTLSLLIRFYLPSGISTVLLAFSVSVSVASTYGHWRTGLLFPETMTGGEFTAQVEVLTAPEARQGFTQYYRFDAKVSNLTCAKTFQNKYCGLLRAHSGPRLVQLSWYSDQPPDLGDVITATLRLRRPHGYQSPDAFDYGRWMFVNGYSASGYVRNPDTVSYNAKNSVLSFKHIRHYAITSIGQRLEQYKHSNIMKALLFADRSGISREQWQMFSRTGTSHLMAISGMHIGIVLAWGLVIGRFLGLLLPKQNSLLLGVGVGLAFSAGYAGLAGFSVPTQRALIMAVVALLGFSLRRSVSVWQGYLAAMLLVLLLDPLAPHRAGFSLSFGAVGILLFALQGRRHSNVFLALIRSQWVVLLGLLPLLMMWGYGVNLVSFPVNLLAIPLLTVVILPLLFLGLVLMAVAPSWSAASWQAADVLLDVFLKYLAMASALFPQFQVSASPLLLFFASLSVLILLLPRGTPAKWLGAIPILIVLFSPAVKPAKGSAWLTVFDVGQGLSVLIQTESKAVLYDVGPNFSSGFNTADAVVIPGLRHFNIRHLDMLVLSHADTDHAGAAPALLNAIPVGELQLGEGVESINLAYSSCHTPREWTWDGVAFQFLDVQGEEHIDLAGNNASCVLKITVGDESLLLVGDIEADIERRLVASQQDLRATLLIAPHHGSNTSSSEEFISAVSPEHVIFSAGRNNQYGHPARVIVNRYARAGSQCWSTAYQGSMRFELNEMAVELTDIWGGGRYYWQTGGLATLNNGEICSKSRSEH
ncbi:DNA internalization-related competence protein ComEC/Rec2 [Zhongshania aliphaticivorans]|nr:DNA internalization-related competence protein ComEC/Rec2 [Zhongshania aliphaticivorans]